VRNYQARNLMRDEMRTGDLVFFYHSNAKPSGIAGLATVCRESHPDPTAWDPDSDYYDPKSTPDAPRWFMVAVRFERAFDELIPLSTLKNCDELQDMVLLKRSRLSVQPVEKKHARVILRMVGVDPKTCGL